MPRTIFGQGEEEGLFLGFASLQRHAWRLGTCLPQGTFPVAPGLRAAHSPLAQLFLREAGGS